MKSLNLVKSCTKVVVVALCIGLPSLVAQTTSNDRDSAARERTCSNAGVAGEWGYVETGNVYPATVAVPFSAVARYTLDEAGNMSGTAVSSSGGTVSSVTLQGVGTVNSDCTGTLKFEVYAGGVFLRTVSVTVVYGNNEREGLGLITSLVLANGTSVPAVLTIDAKKLFHSSAR